MKKNGFTLVELMVVIAVIGVLAAFSFPRLQSAADRKRAAEAPKVLLSIAGAQEAFRIVNGNYLDLNAANDWRRLGLNMPESINFAYTIDITPSVFNPNVVLADPSANPITTLPTFTATAELQRNLFSVNEGETITITEADCRFATEGLRRLVPSFVGTPARTQLCR